MTTSKKLGTQAALAFLCMAATGVASAAGSHFSKVPSDTPLYLGTTVDEHWMTSLGMGDAESLRQALSNLSETDASEGGEPSAAGRFIQVIAEAMLRGGRGGLELVAQPGRLQIYLQGAAPVLRLQLRDGDQFEAYLDKQVKMPDAALSSTSEGSQKIWVPVGDKPEVFAAIDGDDLVLARLSDDTGYPSVTAVVAGGSGFDSNKRMIPAMSSYDLPGSTVGWMDFERLQDSLTDTEHALHAAVKEMVTDPVVWEQFQSVACQADIQRFVRNTPHFIGAANYTELAEQRQIQSAFVWPMTDKKARAAWQALQGMVLANSDAEPPVRLGFGVSGAGVPAFVNYIAADLSSLQCPLWREQAAQSGMGLAMASSMSAMFSTVKGVTAQLFDMDLDSNNNPDPSSVDAQVTVLTDSPSLLLLMMRSALPLPANIPEDGTPVTVNTPLGVPVQLSVYPHSINVFKGAQAAESVKSMKAGVATESALLNYDLDVSWALSKSSDALQGKSPEELLRENGAAAMIPLSADGGIRHLPYGMRMESSAIYAKPEAKKPADAVVVKASD